MMESKKCVLKLGVKNLTTSVLKWLEKKGKYRFFNESKSTYIECIRESEAFKIFKFCNQSKEEKIWKN